MTLVEFFSKNPIENIMGTLFFKPRKTIFVSFGNDMLTKDKSTIEKYLKLKKINSQIEFVNIEKHCFQCAVRTLEGICQSNERCVFDFTGGEELILAAMGYVMAKYDVCAIETNPVENLIYADLNKDLKPIESDITNSVEENFVMCGGMVDESKLKPEKQFLAENSFNEISGLWNICKRNTMLWNSTCVILNSLQDNYFPKENENSVFKSLVKNKFIIINRETEKSYHISYKNKNIQLCLTDPGAVLELYTYYILKQSDKYNDVKIGVTVDWDGYFHRDFDKSKDISNEIDVIAIKGLRPAYISCKNGKVSKETLYELETVSNRFGGSYSAKVLIAPMLKANTVSNQYIMNRAKDMGIKVIADICNITEREFVSQIEEAFLTVRKIKNEVVIKNLDI